jgi:feruloyl esterase
MFRISLLVLLSAALSNALAATPCEKLSSIALAGATITSAALVPAGLWRPPAQAPGRGEQPPVLLPAYCRVAMVLTPSSDSHIESELWMPAEDWNGKFEAVGNGGWAGSISLAAMAAAIKEGYATASNDTGHTGQDPMFGLGHPEKLVDFAYRANHEMTMQARTLISAFYGSNPKLSYWNGCSTGGRQGLMEAQRYPADFDAVVAGAPANPQTHLHAWDMMVGITMLKDEKQFMTPGKLATLNKAVLNACDTLDGVKDGILNDPRKCHFDPAALLCKGDDSDQCLTQPQVDAVKLVYSSAKKKNGELIFPGKMPGGETAWPQLNPAHAPLPLWLGTFQVATYQDASWDWHSFDLDRDTAAADEKFGYVNVSTDLAAFKARGGKLLLYHGWSDQLISPENTVNYYSGVLQKLGAGQDDWIRLFMVPGMQHCQGGPGPDQFNKMAAIERWRESGIAPDRITAFHVTGNTVSMSRPLCPYPQVATYNGVGSTNDAASFACKKP